MSERFFADRPITGDRAVLEGPEAHHLLHVMRAQPGDEVVLFDGSGAEFAARVEQTKRSVVELAVLSQKVVNRELSLAITLGVALPKGDRQKWLVEKLTELGVARLVPLVTHRGVAQPLEAARDRLQRTVIEACKQCERNHLMKIDVPHTVEQFLTGADPQGVRWFAHPGGANLVSEIDRLQNRECELAAVSIAVGPEGGFTDDELAASTANGWRPIDLGSRILRVETAALALASAVGLLAR
jgi:16S rRNA (uracil1498-N3)-methyltransferase